MTLQFLSNTKAEILKCRNTAALWITIGGAAFIPFVNVIKCVARPDYFVPRQLADPWNTWLDDNWQIAAAFFLAMYIILATSLVVQIEYKSNAWKQVYSSPRSFADIFFSKISVILMMIACCFILFNVFQIAAGYLTEFLERRYTFSSHAIPLDRMATITVNMFGSILAMTSIQFWLSLSFKNFIVPMGIGLGLFTTGFMIRQWEHIDFYPYVYPLLVYFPNPGHANNIIDRVELKSLLLSFAVLLLGFVHTSLRKHKG